MKFIYLSLLLLITLSSTAQNQNALKFDGANDYVQVLQPGPTGNSSRTVEAWVKLSTISSSQKVILDWGDMAFGHRFTLNIINGTPRIEVGGDGINAASSISMGAWHHIAASYDSVSTVFSIYVDGLLSNSGILTVAVATTTANGIIVGRRNDAVNNFDGTIDEVRVWNIVRSQSDIMAAKSSEFCSAVAGLVAYYKFNQGTATGNNVGLTTLNDLSGNNNNGTLNGFTLTGTNSNWVTGNSFTGGNTFATINPSTCGNYTSPGGNVYATSGTYHDTLANANGCDSIITINLSINAINAAVLATSLSLIAQQASAMYQWVNCANNFSFVAGQTANTFSPTVSGNYAVIITIGSCIDTSVCINFIISGIDEYSVAEGLNMWPNPTVNHCAITAPRFVKSTLTLYDIMGKELLHQPFNTAATFNTTQLISGVYTVKIKDKEGRSAVRKMVKK